MKQPVIINIGRQFGSGGHFIGEKLADMLGFAFYDKELINLASKESGLGKEFFEKADEKSRFGILTGFLGLRAGINSDEFVNNYINNESLFKIQSDVIKKLAEKGPSVFVGRCADYILRENPSCLNIFISSNWEDRVARVMVRQPMDRDKVEELLTRTDKKRAGYYNYYTNKTWGYAASYHLCIDSSLLGVEDTVDFIIDLLKRSKRI